MTLGLPPRSPAAPPLPAPATGGDVPESSEPPPPPPPAPPAGSGRSVQARTDDRDPDHLKLILSRTTLLAGDVKVEFNNAFAEDPHDLVVERASTSHAFAELQPGEVERRTIALDAGEWRLRCTIPTHAERGMTAALIVTG
jgi:plastocyanin